MLYTLDNTNANSFPYNLTLVRHGQSAAYSDLNIPVSKPQKKYPGLNGALNTNVDVFPPGFREQMHNPSLYAGPYAGTTFSHYGSGRTGNAPALLNYDVPTTFFAGEHAQRTAAAWWDILHNTANDQHFMFRDLGNFSVPYTGFTPIADIKLNTNRGVLL